MLLIRTTNGMYINVLLSAGPEYSAKGIDFFRQRLLEEMRYILLDNLLHTTVVSSGKVF